MKRILLLLGLLLASLLDGFALVVNDYDPQVNDRFASGYPDSPLPNSSPKFVGKDLDWSGVGWLKKDPGFSVTLISARNFVYAKHVPPAIGDAIEFLGRDGHIHEYHIAKLQEMLLGKQGAEDVRPDAAIGTLTETVALDDQVAHYPIVSSQKGVEPFIGKKILMYGKMARIGANEIVEGLALPGVASEYNVRTNGLTSGMGKCEIGDSGSPAFMVIDGKLALVGTHWKFDTDSMVSGIIPLITPILEVDGEKLETVPLGN